MTPKTVFGADLGESGLAFRAKRARANDEQALEDMYGRGLTADECGRINRMYQDCLDEPREWPWKQIAIVLACVLVVVTSWFAYLVIEVLNRT